MPSFLRSKDGKSLEVFAYGDIGGPGGISAEWLADLLGKNQDVSLIQLRISSFGGSANEGITIYNLLSRHPARIEVDIDGMCASAASVIAMAGDEIRIASNGMMLIHEAGGFPPGRGTADEHESAAAMLRTLNDGVVGIYAARTKLPAEQLASIMAADQPMGAEEAVKLGFATKIVEPIEVAAHATQYRLAADMPKADEQKPAAPDSPAQEPAPKSDEGSAQGDFNALGDTLAKLTGFDRNAILALLIDGQDALAEMVKQALNAANPAQAHGAMAASMRMTFTEARLHADERAKLTARVAELEAEKASAKDKEVRAHVAKLVSEGFVRPGDQDIEDAVFAFTNAPERAARMYAAKLVPVNEPSQVETPKSSTTLLALDDLTPAERLSVQGMTWMSTQDAIKRVVSRRKEN